MNTLSVHKTNKPHVHQFTSIWNELIQQKVTSRRNSLLPSCSVKTEIIFTSPEWITRGQKYALKFLIKICYYEKPICYKITSYRASSPLNVHSINCVTVITIASVTANKILTPTITLKIFWKWVLLLKRLASEKDWTSCAASLFQKPMPLNFTNGFVKSIFPAWLIEG